MPGSLGPEIGFEIHKGLRTEKTRFWQTKKEFHLHLWEVIKIMSTQAKYGWAIGLIVIGIVFALPFRNTASDDKQVAKVDAAKSEAASQPENEIQQDTEKKVAQSNLLPNSDTVIQKFDESVETQNQPTSQSFVEQVPNRFTPPVAEENQIIKDDQAAKLQPVEFSNNQAKQQMPENVGPYKMKRVPSSHFMSASQSNQNQVFQNASRTRKVVHYKLRDGDSLRSIAKRYLGDSNRYEEILADNQHILTNGESFLPVGQYITIVAQ